MKLGSEFLAAVLFASLTAAVAGCESRNEGAEVETTVTADTGALGGLTPAEIRARAEPMSPEVAESLGIVDTTIHVEVHDPNDTLPIQRPSQP